MTTHFDILSYIQALPEKNTDGNGDPLVALAELRTISKAIEAATKVVDSWAIDEAHKYPTSFEYKGFKFTRSDGKRKYVLDDIEEYMIALRALKAREQMHKDAGDMALKGNRYVTDDGEVIQPARVESTKASLSVK